MSIDAELEIEKKLLDFVRIAKSKYGRDFNMGVKYQEVLRYFLVSCYSGLRHSDIFTLGREHIKGSHIVKEVVKGREGKHKLVRIPIRKRLYSLLDMNTPKGILFPNRVMECSQTNKYLMQIMKIADINKHVTFHVARHTFAVVSLMLGMTIETVQKILCHSELNTTQRYAKVTDRLKESEMNKWDKIAKDDFDSDGCRDIICPECENIVLRFDFNAVRLSKIPCTCQLCDKQFLFDLKANKDQRSELGMFPTRLGLAS